MYPNFCEIFNEEIYIVGGAVRDQLLDVEVFDVDIASAIHPRPFKALCNKLGYKTFDTGIEHGTVTVLIDGKPYEHTTFREDISCDGRNASVSFSKTIEEDLSRRDFTINAIAMLNDKLIDPYDGQIDLQNRILKTVGIAKERFCEDYLRIIRAARFASRLNMTIDPELFIAAKDLAPKILDHVSVERISDEFKKAKPHAAEFLACLHNMEILDLMFPNSSEINSNPNWWQEVGRASKFDIETYFASFMRPLKDKELVELVCRKYKLSRSIIRFSNQLVSHLPYLMSEDFSIEKSYQMIKSCGDNFERLMNYADKIIIHDSRPKVLENTSNYLD